MLMYINKIRESDEQERKKNEVLNQVKLKRQIIVNIRNQSLNIRSYQIA